MFLAHRILLRPTKEQEAYFRRAAGTRRYAYNHGLAEYKAALDALQRGETSDKPNVRKIRDALVARKKTDLAWLKDVSKHVVGNAMEDLQAALDKFFKKTAGFPKFKSKHSCDDRFTVDASTDTAIVMDGKRMRLPLVGWIKTTEVLRFDGRIKRATVSRQADKWFVSILVDVGDRRYHAPVKLPDTAVGVDLGINRLATFSDETVVENPRPYRRHERKLQTLQRRLSKKVRGSENYKRAKTKLAKVHARVTNIRNDTLHKLTTRLTATYGHVVIEDLNVRGMMRGTMAKSIADAGFYTFKTMLDYKSDLRGGMIHLADRFFPSSQLCSCCGSRKKLKRSDRVFACDECGVEVDRDLNAAINLEHLYYGVIA